jgi:hypothetical protein
VARAGVGVCAATTATALGECAWEAVGMPAVTNAVYSAAEWDPDGRGGPLGSRIVVGGNFPAAGGNPGIRQLAMLDQRTGTWTGFGPGGGQRGPPLL